MATTKQRKQVRKTESPDAGDTPTIRQEVKALTKAAKTEKPRGAKDFVLYSESIHRIGDVLLAAEKVSFDGCDTPDDAMRRVLEDYVLNAVEVIDAATLCRVAEATADCERQQRAKIKVAS